MKFVTYLIFILSSSNVFAALAAEYRSPISMSLGYSVSTNLLKQDAEKYSHYLTLGLSYIEWKPWSLGISTGVAYYSIGSDIPAKNDNPSVDDVDLSIERSFEINSINSLNSSFDWTFPTSTESQYEQYNGIGVLSNQLVTELGKYFALVNSLELGYIAQTNQFSPTSNEINVSHFAGYMIGLIAKIGAGFSLSATTGIKASTYTDGTSSLEKSKAGTWTLGLSYKYKKFGAGLRFVNGNYDDEGPARYFAQDIYNQKVAGKISYEF
jgi:hypothetical protein